MSPALQRFLGILTIALVLIGAGASAASASSNNHGRTIWFNDTEIDDDTIDGDLNVLFAKVSCSDSTIGGDVNVYFGSFDQLDGCKVTGEVNSVFDPSSVGMFAPWVAPQLLGSEVLHENRRLLEQLAWDVVVLFAFLLFPLRVRIALDRVERYPVIAAGMGTLATVAIIPVAVLLAISLVGIPLIVLEIAALFAGLWIGQAAVALLIGRRLYELSRPHATPSPLTALILGLVLISAAEILPVVGWGVMALVWLVGLGAAVLSCWRELPFGTPSNVPPAAGAPMNRPA
jgi:hypothetical protein